MCSWPLTEVLRMRYDGQPLMRGYVVEKIERPAMPKIENTTQSIPGKNGVLFRRQNRMERVLKVTIRQIAEANTPFFLARERLRDSLFAFRAYVEKDTPKRLELSDQPLTYDMAILDDLDQDIEATTLLLECSFLLPDGFSRDRSMTTLGLKDGENHIFYDGTEPTPIQVRGNISSESVVLFNQTAAEKMTILHATNGIAARIDTEQETYRENDVLCMPKIPPASDFPWLYPGNNTLFLSGLTGASISYEGRRL